jgi:hypothetical protein
MSDSPSSDERYTPGKAVYWHREAGSVVRAVVRNPSATGKRIRIAFTWRRTDGREITECTYVKATSLSIRHD